MLARNVRLVLIELIPDIFVPLETEIQLTFVEFQWLLCIDTKPSPAAKLLHEVRKALEKFAKRISRNLPKELSSNKQACDHLNLWQRVLERGKACPSPI